MNGCIRGSFLIKDTNKLQSKRWIVGYDFRKDFVNLHSWLQEKRKRPSADFCDQEHLKDQIEQSIVAGSSMSKDFFVIVHRWPEKFLHIRSCKGPNGCVYIESSSDPLYDGGNFTSLDVVSTEKVVQNSSLSKSLILWICKKTNDITSLTGSGTIVEMPLVEGELYLLSAQRDTLEAQRILERPEVPWTGDIRIVSPGKASGVLAIVHPASTGEFPAERYEKIIFGVSNPSTNLTALTGKAEGFLFERGSVLSHLAILLREKKIPAMIVTNLFRRYFAGKRIRFDTRLREIEVIDS